MLRIVQLLSSIALLLSVAFPIGVAVATTWNVPGDAATIQAGIDIASVGDTVLVAPGTYTGVGNRDISFLGKDLVVRSAAGPEATILDCKLPGEDAHRGFHLENGETRAARIDGFTIKNGGTRSSIPINGGGISCEVSSPTIANCIITHCYAGGGPWPKTASGNSEGAAIAGVGTGGGIGIMGGAARIENCVIAGNATNGGGGGITVIASGAEVVNCVITGNGPSGLAVHGTDIRVENCTISGNDDWGLSCGTATSVTVERTIIWGNCDSGIPRTIRLQDSTTTMSAYCVLVDTAGFGGGGTISYIGPSYYSDPMFCNPTSCALAPSEGGFYLLESASPGLPENNACGVLIGALGSCAATSVPTPGLPGGATLSVYPNPSISSTQMRYSLADDVPAQLMIFDAAGRRVRAFALSGKTGSLVWDGQDSAGRVVAPGAYFLRLESGDRSEVRRLIRLR